MFVTFVTWPITPVLQRSAIFVVEGLFSWSENAPPPPLVVVDVDNLLFSTSVAAEEGRAPSVGEDGLLPLASEEEMKLSVDNPDPSSTADVLDLLDTVLLSYVQD